MSASPTYMRLKGQSLVYAVTMCCSIGFLLFGDIGFMGGLTTSNEFLNTFNNPNSSLLGFLISGLPRAFQCLFAITVLCLIPFLPESPRYLAATGQQERASYVLAALRGHPEDHPEVTFELQKISYAIAVESQEAGSWSDVFKDHGISGWQRVLMACTANFFQQMSGVNVMTPLGPYILRTPLVSARIMLYLFPEVFKFSTSSAA
ncbi:hypothetical protein V1504DRAFT_68776 [Lipomyces starkeyi]